MGALMAYALVSAMALLAMYLVYKCMLADRNRCTFNRAILLAIYIAAFAVPLFPALRLGGAGAAQVRIGEIVAEAVPMAEAASAVTGFDIWQWLLGIYFAGVAAMLLHTAVVVLRLVAMVRAGEHISIEGRGFTLVLTDDGAVAPFSWWRYVVMSREDYRLYGDVICRHELSHLAARHWEDLLLAQLAVVVQWFNPAAWLMRDELRTVHEYQADMAVISSGVDVREYQMLLIKKAVGARFPSLANSLNHSQLKKRVTMMYKNQFPKGRSLRGFALLPAVAVVLAAVNVPAVASLITDAQHAEISLSSGKDSEKSDRQVKILGAKSLEASPGADCDSVTYIVDGRNASREEVEALPTSSIKSITVLKRGENKVVVNTDAGTQPDEVAYSAVEQMPRTQGGEQGLLRFLAENIRYPEEAMKEGAHGRAVVKFVVQADGKVGNPEIIRSTGNEQLDAEALRVVTTIPDFTPGLVDGKPVACYYTLPISFSLKSDDTPAAE